MTNEYGCGNRLAIKLGIVDEEDPLVAFEKNPGGYTLSRIGKQMQTSEMVQRAVENDDGRWTILKFISKRFVTLEICVIACEKNGDNLDYVPDKLLNYDIYKAAVSNKGELLSKVPKELRTYEMCELAVENDSSKIANYCALKQVPHSLLIGNEGRRLCNAAVKHNSLAIAYVPSEFVTKTMAHDVVANSYPGEYCSSPYYHSGESRFVPARDWPIAHLPKEVMSVELVEFSIEQFPASFKYVPLEYVSDEMCLKFIQQDVSYLRYLPEAYRGRKPIVNAALAASPCALQYIPEEKRTRARCFKAMERDSNVSVAWFPEKVRAEYEATHSVAVPVISSNPIALATPESPTANAIAVSDGNKTMIHELTIADDSSVRTVYYVSDIHLEHQLDLDGKTLSEVKAMIADKVSELVNSVQDKCGTILIAGDVADSVELEKLFYETLSHALSRACWDTRVIAVLGNHELWDSDSMGVSKSRSVDEIIGGYRQVVRADLLENELYLEYKGRQAVRIDENTLLEADADELSELCQKSTFIVLGGIGFSGLNPKFNAAMGLYGNAISMEEDIARSERFRVVYEKVLRCAASQQVIVLTHMQMVDWSNAEYNPNWVYVTGHTHQNSLIRKEDGTTVLSDNQIGYKPKYWHFNGFTVCGRYDPFADWKDGIYSIRPQQYVDFNRGCGIAMSDFKRAGDIYMLKRDGIYMFFLKDKNLYMLEGGNIHTVEHDLDYYLDNLSLYQQRVKAAFAPYHAALEMISKEIKAFGGEGSIHGCIVDVDFFNHVYLNPFDGKITPYFAWDMASRLTYKNIPALLESSPRPPRLPDGTHLLVRYKKACADGSLPILAAQSHNEKMALATVPELVLDRSMYEPSRIMRSVQYIFDQNIIRVWKDEVLTADTIGDESATTGSLPRLIGDGK